ncbi:MAG TPA: HEAT repeat domain-containing protein, partial [Phycisphaerales bacterium]|nr:HEAT repeat domain-containing protein [Phycisphaerales bacterium]
SDQSAAAYANTRNLAPAEDFNNPLVRSALREQAIETILAGARSRDPSIRANATEAALFAPARLESIVAASLKDDNIGVRAVGGVVVGKAQLRSLAPALWPLLSDSSPYVSSAAIFGLRRCGEDVDPTPLSNSLNNDPSTKIRSHAAYLLGELGDRSAVPMLRAAARRPMPRASDSDRRLMELQIAEALVKLGDEPQIMAIRAALYPSSIEALEATALAVQIIGTLKDQGAADQLIYLSAKTDEAGNLMPAEIRLGIAASLAMIGNRRGDFIAQEFVNSANPVLRAQTAFVFGATATNEGLAVLQRFMSSDDSEQVRLASAAGVLKAIGTEPRR